MPFRVQVGLPGPFVWSPRSRAEQRPRGERGAGPEGMLVGLFAAVTLGGWVGLAWCWRHGTVAGVLGVLGYVLALLLGALLWRWVTGVDSDLDEESVRNGGRVLLALTVGVPVLYGNAMAWWIPPLGVVVGVLTAGAVGVAIVVHRRQRAAERLVATLEADAAEEAAIQAEIDAEEALRVQRRTMGPVPARSWAPGPPVHAREERPGGFAMPSWPPL